MNNHGLHPQKPVQRPEGAQPVRGLLPAPRHPLRLLRAQALLPRPAHPPRHLRPLSPPGASKQAGRGEAWREVSRDPPQASLLSLQVSTSNMYYVEAKRCMIPDDRNLYDGFRDFRTIDFLMRHLHQMSLHSDRTGMTSKNLAIVWSPNILRCDVSELDTQDALQVQIWYRCTAPGTDMRVVSDRYRKVQICTGTAPGTDMCTCVLLCLLNRAINYFRET